MNLNIGGGFIAIGTGFMIVLTSASLIRADGDDVRAAKQAALLSVLSRSERGDQPTPVWSIRTTSSRRAAALRLTDRGNRLLRAGEYEQAVSSFEKALGIEANPYIYFYLARAHYQLGHYQDASNFLEVAESWLMQLLDWAPMLVALKGQIPGSGVSLQVRRSVVFAGGLPANAVHRADREQ